MGMHIVHGRRKKAPRDAPQLLSLMAAICRHSAMARRARSFIGAPTLFRAVRPEVPSAPYTLFAAQPCLQHPSLQLRTQIRRQLVPKMQMLRGTRPLRIRIEDDKVRVAARGKRSLLVRSVPPTAPAPRHPFAQLVPSPSPRWLIPVHSTGSASPRLAIPPHASSQRPSITLLHLRRTRGVIGRYHVDQAIFKRLPQPLAILRTPNRRRAFVLRRAIGNLFCGKPQIVRTGLHGDGHAAFARFGEHRQSLLRWRDERYESASRTLPPAESAAQSLQAPPRPAAKQGRWSTSASLRSTH